MLSIITYSHVQVSKSTLCVKLCCGITNAFQFVIFPDTQHLYNFINHIRLSLLYKEH